MDYDDDFVDDYEMEGLPVVDDIEIAALAAEGWHTRNRKAFGESDEMDESDTESSSSDEEHSSSDEDTPKEILGRLKLNLEVDPQDENVTVRLVGGETQESDSDSSSACSDPLEDPDMKELLANVILYGDDARAADKELEENMTALPPLEPLDIKLSADEPIKPAGEISAVLAGDQIVVQAPENCSVLDEGSLLCLESRALLGKIDEVFGAITEPLYSLRYAGDQPMPAEVTTGAQVFSVQSHSQYIAQTELEANTRLSDEEGDEELIETDNAEAQLLQMYMPGSHQNGFRGQSAFGGSQTQQFPERSRQNAPEGDDRRSAAFGQNSAQGGFGKPANKLAPKVSKPIQKSKPPRKQQHQPSSRVARSLQQPEAAQPSHHGGPPPGGRWVWIPEAEPAQQSNPNPDQANAALAAPDLASLHVGNHQGRPRHSNPQHGHQAASLAPLPGGMSFANRPPQSQLVGQFQQPRTNFEPWSGGAAPLVQGAQIQHQFARPFSQPAPASAAYGMARGPPQHNGSDQQYWDPQRQLQDPWVRPPQAWHEQSSHHVQQVSGDFHQSHALPHRQGMPGQYHHQSHQYQQGQGNLQQWPPPEHHYRPPPR